MSLEFLRKAGSESRVAAFDAAFSTQN